ncbi:MAG: hypothetical protein VX938_06795, partial [Myxococcota bacterium]|nr:hypothetical protein [Myxococcota bacterium]
MEEAPETEEEAPRLPEPNPADWMGLAAASVSALLLWWLTAGGRDPGALAAAHPTLLGAPGELGFALVAASVLALRSTSSPLAWWSLTLGLLWTSVTLWMPVHQFTQARWGFEALMGTWDVGIWPGVAWLILSLSTLSGWWLVARHAASETTDEGLT